MEFVMSANGTRMTIARQWEVLKLLPSRAPGHTVKEITQRLESEGFSISKRSVERDLVELSRIFRSSVTTKASHMAGIGVRTQLLICRVYR